MVPEITVRHCSSTSVDLRYSSASKKSYPFLQSNAVIIPSFKPTQNIWTTRHFCCDHLSIKGFRDSSVYCTAGSSLQPFSQANLALILRMDLWRNLWAVSARARTQTMLPTCRLIKLPFSLWFIGQCTPGFEEIVLDNRCWTWRPTWTGGNGCTFYKAKSTADLTSHLFNWSNALLLRY